MGYGDRVGGGGRSDVKNNTADRCRRTEYRVDTHASRRPQQEPAEEKPQAGWVERRGTLEAPVADQDCAKAGIRSRPCALWKYSRSLPSLVLRWGHRWRLDARTLGCLFLGVLVLLGFEGWRVGEFLLLHVHGELHGAVGTGRDLETIQFHGDAFLAD